jgi:hypothetical protein
MARRLNLDEAEALLVLDELVPTQLPQLAADMLVDGLDSPALRVLAGRHPDEAGLGKQFAQALRELGRAQPATRCEALTILARIRAEQLLASEISLKEGAGELFNIFWRARSMGCEELPTTLVSFVGPLADGPALGAKASAIRREAKALLAHLPKRTTSEAQEGEIPEDV